MSAAILALFPPFSEAEGRVALTLYRLLADHGAVSGNALANASGVSPEQTEAMLSRWPGVYRGDDGRIIGYGGLTTAATKHRIRIGRNTRYAWCAWDTLFVPKLLASSARLESTCPVTGESIALMVHPDGIEPAGERPAVSLVAPDAATAAADIVEYFCCHVHFFATERAGTQWGAQRPGTLLVTLDQAWLLGRRQNARRYPMLAS